ncbi:MAG: hypothetical protein H0V01_09320 [Bacteroidetes bacterium]|nr:hypothetical protein [Bacteroidota bacterium]HET6243060.1 hypothetical protein [Bacteroidia bacterium]
MTKINCFFITIYCAFTLANCIAQGKTVFKKPEDTVRYSDTVVNINYGVRMFDKYNNILGGDSIRNCRNYACQGWVEDFYENGKTLHKGFYIEGILNSYKNFYPDGTLEREFKNKSLVKSELTTYHPNGNIRTKGVFVEGSSLIYEEYYETGQLEYMEENHKSMEYYVSTKSFYSTGTQESILLLTNPKKLTFSKVEYHENGTIREQGELFFNKNNMDYYKSGKWSYFDETSKLTHETLYENGKSIKTINY